MASVKVHVVDNLGNPLEGADVHVSGCGSTNGGTTDANGNANIPSCYVIGGGTVWITVSATGYQTVSNVTAPVPGWPWATTTTTVTLQPAPIGTGPGGTCPTGYTLDPETGLCNANATSNYWSNFVNALTTYATDLVIVGSVGAVIYVGYRVYSKHQDGKTWSKRLI